MHIVTVSCATWVEAMKLKAYTQRILIRKDEYSSILNDREWFFGYVAVFQA